MRKLLLVCAAAAAAAAAATATAAAAVDLEEGNLLLHVRELTLGMRVRVCTWVHIGGVYVRLYVRVCARSTRYSAAGCCALRLLRVHV